ncbi:alpha-mannosidase [Candidatus Latescibacterota bacterium]
MTQSPSEDERIVAEEPDFPPRGAERGPVDLSAITLHMVGHAHIDLGYRWNQAETVHYVSPWTLRGVLDLMDRTPGFTFCQSQMYLYEAMRREYPDIFARIREAIRAGSWEVVGGTWSEYDAILPSGEAVIRQYLHGVRYASDLLGVDEHRVAFVPDSFCGHPATLPQILAGCGFEYYVFGRGLPQNPEAPEKTRRAFRWVGPDGGSIIAFVPFGPYSTPPLTEEHLHSLLPYARASVSSQELVLYGQGDHGGGPRDAEIQSLHSLADLKGAPRWRFSTVHQLCREAFDEDTVGRLGEHRGNLGGFASGSLTSQAQIKRRNRILEKQMLCAEATAVIGTLLSRKPAYPRLEVRDLWRRLLTEQFHDILPGTSVASVYRDTHEAYDEVVEGAGWLIGDGFARLRSRLDTQGEGVSLVAYNAGLLPAAAAITVAVPDWVSSSLGNATRLVDGDGADVPCHLADGRLTFAPDLPSLGHAAYRLLPGGADDTYRGTSLQDGTLDTPRFRLSFDLATGNLVGLEDKRSQRQLLCGPSNTLDLRPEMGIATAWVHAFDGDPVNLQLVEPPRITESNPFFTRVTTVSRSASSTFEREITVCANSDRVDFRLVTEWREGNGFLKLGFEPELDGPRVCASLAHGSARVEDPSREFCMHDFVDLRDERGGMVVLNDGAYGCDLVDGRLGISVIRTVRDMDPTMAHGRHELRYSLVPYAGELSQSQILHHGASFDHRILAAFEPDHPGGIRTWGSFDNSQPLPPAHSFVRVDDPHVVVCAFKIPEEDWQPLSFVVRLREVDGEAVECWLDLPVPVSSAVVADHLERPADARLVCEGRRVRLSLRPFEIATLVAYV